MEVEMILKHSPFKTMDDLRAQFNKIEGNHGTLAAVYNLKLLDDGRPELGKNVNIHIKIYSKTTLKTYFYEYTLALRCIE